SSSAALAFPSKSTRVFSNSSAPQLGHWAAQLRKYSVIPLLPNTWPSSHWNEREADALHAAHPVIRFCASLTDALPTATNSTPSVKKCCFISSTSSASSL